EQAVLVAEALIDGGGHLDPAEFAERLVVWEQRMRERGSLDLLGPSTKAAVAAILAGVPASESGRHGTTNGAAMRVAPVGILMPSGDLSALVERVVEASSVTHNTGVALAGASAVAAAVSAGVDGASVAEATQLGIRAARLAAGRGHWVAAASVHHRIEWAVSMADPADAGASLERIRNLIGTSLATQESVPAAFGVLAVFGDDPWGACLAAASQGGDSDTIAAMVGAVAGACTGIGGFPAAAVDTVRKVNRLHLGPLVDRLLELRA
ncbi:MAG TPA: ADP-ribosylglycohydrolase family protein, partial [Terrimesophilobacter sp.]|nr:ADP-ribosylglycohydrolase family protein [Terrimesophilobacter sp.]